ncbi:hypothetical protein EN836_07330 [Mesorhizobium sp. M1C.F.Ca.ET.193.01.1.1]|uniref:hypothetical protein n=2 Tax=Mesorhizobium TaxID=68287 RepID=UPI000FD35C1F|nr:MULTISPECIES: hypothetical protein [unclassified Mesorhizobium]TGT02521.1 hypothetical protein EN820_25770 [bacterium M00.F.Ca.ET.177.01.1.1]RWA76051.1 MAG: hypothetical protein EOQ28_07660 [Mesorhizobium sp.]RWC04133.1 MAG: hypothetical protein EOQ57_07080 [Mesorhizobium sp.]RWG78158.1 MAG: hypothetical protein EOQ69_27025 [Mesorhizobium sp.]RWG90828.1 MAG: hypothetical protein EOQ70_03805 [Mesorhizobium sp.]
MVGEMQVPVVPAGGPAFVAEQHIDQVVVHAPLVRPEPFHQLGYVKDRVPAAGKAVDRKPGASFELLAERVFCERKPHCHGDPRKMGRRTGEDYIPHPEEAGNYKI